MELLIHRTLLRIPTVATLIVAAVLSMPASGGPGAAALAAVSTDLGSSASPVQFACDPSNLACASTFPSLTRLLGTSINNGQTSASAAAPCPPPPFLCVTPALVPGASGEAYASADLATGTLKVYSSTIGHVYNPDFDLFVPLLQSQAQAAFEDTLTVSQGGVLTFDIGISGTNLGSSDGGAFESINFSINGSGAQTIDGHGLFSNLEGVGAGCDDPGVCNNQFIVEVPVASGDALDFVLSFVAGAEDDTADFSHTLTLGASGVPFTSASGVFLTEVTPPGSVPEPATLALIAVGLAGLASTRRKR